MKSIVIIIVSIFLIVDSVEGQIPEISKKWERSILQDFDTLELKEYRSVNFSPILSNRLRFDGDPWSAYTGVFGPNNHRIDFHLQVEQSNKPNEYVVEGKSKLGNNIRELKGKIMLRKIVKAPVAYIVVFEYTLQESGDRYGDGCFKGIGSIACNIVNNSPSMFWSESGDYRQYNNMFIGEWKMYNSEVSRECIFSFNPSGTYTKLPFRDFLYKPTKSEEESHNFYEIKDCYRVYGWKDYIDSDGYKTAWYKQGESNLTTVYASGMKHIMRSAELWNSYMLTGQDTTTSNKRYK